MNRQVLVTGGTGFVGRQIVRALSTHQVDITLVVRRGKESDVTAFPALKRVISTSDLFQEPAEWWSSQLRDIDTVVHAAWYVEPGKYLQSPNNLDCLSGTLNLAKGAARAGVRRMVGVGTCLECDLSQGDVWEDTTLNPQTPYAAAKAAAYIALAQWLPTQSITFAWCRLFYLYGEGEDDRRLVPYLHARLSTGQKAELTSGSQVRDYLDVAVAGKMIADVAIQPRQGVANICSGVPITVRQLAERIADQYGRRDLLAFAARPESKSEPPYILGHSGPRPEHA